MLKIEKMKEFWIIKISVFLCRQVHGVPQEAHRKKNILQSQWNMKVIIYNLQSIYQDNEKVF